MKKFRCLLLILISGLFMAFSAYSVADDDVAVSCTSPTATASANGGTTTINVNCVIYAPDADSSYRVTSSSNNLMSPTMAYLNRGLSFLTASLQPTVTSPDNSVTSISGTSSGFTARLSSSSAPKNLRFLYSVTTSSSTPSGLYASFLTPASYRYRICRNTSCSGQVFSGTATAAMSVNVASSPVTVSCASPSVNATAGGGPFNLDIVCTLSGGSPDNLSPSNQNSFSPSTVTLSKGNSSLTATLQSSVTSPDSSVTGISGTAGGGFSGNVNSVPAKIQVRYSGTTLNTTSAGTYTSAPVLFTWSTI